MAGPSITHTTHSGSGSGPGGTISSTEWDATHTITGLQGVGNHVGGVISGAYVGTFCNGFASPSALAMAANNLILVPYVPPVSFTADRIGVASSSTAGGNAKLIAYVGDNGGWPGTLMFESADIAISATGTNYYATCSLSFVAGQTYWLGVRTSGTPQLLSQYTAFQTLGTPNGTPSSGQYRYIKRTLTYATAAPSAFSFAGTSDFQTSGDVLWVGLRAA